MHPRITPAARGGIEGWLDVASGRWVPRLAGGGPEDPAPDPGPDPDPTPDPDPQPDPKPADDPLGPEGKAALERERAARRDAEKKVRDYEKQAKQAERERQEADDRAKAEQGRYKELWESEKARADAAEARHAERDAKEAEAVRKDKWLTAARTLKARNAEAVYAYAVYRGQADTDDPALVESTLGDIKKENPDWFDQRQRSGADLNPTGVGSAVSPEDRLSVATGGLQRLMSVQRNNSGGP
jgi:hypothetical protein